MSDPAEAIDLRGRHIVALVDNKVISSVTKVHRHSYDIDNAVNSVAVRCYSCSTNLDAL